jgi:hypothetical protein
MQCVKKTGSPEGELKEKRYDKKVLYSYDVSITAVPTEMTSQP